MGFTKRELIEFLDGLVELASEENKAKAVLVKERFLSDFEKSYGYEKGVITEVSSLPPYYIAAMPDSVQEEIRQKVIAALTEHGECTPENGGAAGLCAPPDLLTDGGRRRALNLYGAEKARPAL